MNDNEENVTNFKNLLYNKFQSSNILSDLKAKMRHDLLQNLISETNEENIKKEIPTNPNFFHMKIINNLIIDYLKKQNHNYTYSIFLTEAKLIENNLSNEELDDYFTENCSFWNSKVNQQINNETFLEKLLYLFFDKKIVKKFANHSCQTEELDKQSLTGLMENIEKNFETKLGKVARRTTENQEEAFNKYQKIVEDKYQIMLKEEVERIRIFEIEKLKYEENQKFLVKVNEMQKEAERNNLERLRRISEREENALKLCKAKIEEIDRKNYENRQQLLLEMDKLKQKEKELEKKYSFGKTNIEEKEKQLKETEKELRTNIEEYERARLILEEKIKENLAERKKHSDKNQIKTENILKVQNELQSEKEGGRRFKESIKILETETTYLRKENESLTKENKDLSRVKNDQYEQIEELRITINSLRERIEFMMNELSAKEDYIKKMNERVEYQDKQLEDLQKNLDLKRNEIVDIYRNYQTDIEKYQALLQDKQKKLHNNIIGSQNIQKPENIDLRKAKIKKLLEEVELEVASPIKEKKTWSKKNDDKIFEDFNDLKKKFKNVIESEKDDNKENLKNYSNLSKNYQNLDGLTITQPNFIEESIPLNNSKKKEGNFTKNDSYVINENFNKKDNFINISNNLIEKLQLPDEFNKTKKENRTIEHSKIPSSSKFEKSLDRYASEIKNYPLELPLFSDSNKSENFKTPQVLSPQAKAMEQDTNDYKLDLRKSNTTNSKHSIKEIPKEKIESPKYLEDEIIKNNHKNNKAKDNNNYFNSFENEKKLEATQNSQRDHSNEKKKSTISDHSKSKDSFNEKDNIKKGTKSTKQNFEIIPIDSSNKKLDFSPISEPFSNEKSNFDNIYPKNANLNSLNSLPVLASKLNDSQKNENYSLFEEKINKTMELEPPKKELNFFKKKQAQLDDSNKKNNFEESYKKASDGNCKSKTLASTESNKVAEDAPKKNSADSNKDVVYKNDNNLNSSKNKSDEKLSQNLPEIRKPTKLPEFERKKNDYAKEEKNKNSDVNFLNSKNEEKKLDNKIQLKNELDEFDDLLNDLDFGNFSDKKTIIEKNDNIKAKSNVPEKKVEKKEEKVKDQEELDFEILEEIEEQGFI